MIKIAVFFVSLVLTALIFFVSPSLAQSFNTYDYLTGRKDPLQFNYDFYQNQRNNQREMEQRLHELEMERLMRYQNYILQQQQNQQYDYYNRYRK